MNSLMDIGPAHAELRRERLKQPEYSRGSVPSMCGSGERFGTFETSIDTVVPADCDVQSARRAEPRPRRIADRSMML